MKRFWFTLSAIIIYQMMCMGQDFHTLNDQFIALYEKAAYKQAIPIGEKALMQAKKEFGDAHINYAIAAENLANAYSHAGEAPPAIKNFRIAKSAYIKVAGENIVEVGLVDNAIGNVYLSNEQYDSAYTYFVKSYNYFLQYPEDQYPSLVVVAANLCSVLQTLDYSKDLQTVANDMLPAIEKKEGKKSEAYISMLINMVVALRSQSMTDSALVHLQVAANLSSEFYGAASTPYASALDMLTDLHRILSQFAEAEKQLHQSRLIRTKLTEPDDYGMAGHYHIAANLYGDMARFDLSDLYYDSAIVLMQKAGLQADEMYTTILRSQAYTDVGAGRLIKAKTNLQNLLNIYEKKYGDQYLGSAEVLVTLGNIEYQTNALAAAQEHVAKGLAIHNKFAGDETSLTATAYEVQGLIKHKLGKSAEGLTLLEKALALNKKLNGEVNGYTASTLSNLGIIYQENGDYTEAEKVLRQSYIIRSKLYGYDHPQCAIAMNNLAAVLIAQSRFSDADKLLAASIEILKAKGMIGSNIALTTINNIALLMEKQNENETASKLYEQVLTLLKKDSLQNSTVLESVLSNLCLNKINQQKYEEALAYGKEAMAYAEKVAGKNSLNYIRAGNNYMVVLVKTKAFDKARELGKALEKSTKITLGDSAEMMVKIYSNLSSIEAQTGNIAAAIAYLNKSLLLQTANYEKTLYALSERDQVAYWKDQAYLFQLFPALLLATNTPDTAMVSAMVNQQLSLKGFVLTNATASLKKAREIKDPQLQQLMDAWQSSKTLYLKQTTLPVAERQYSIDSLGAVANNLEQAINRKAGKNLLTKQSTITWQQVQRSLQPNEAAIEFLRYPPFSHQNYADSLHFAAIVITKNAAPVLVPLGSESMVQWCMSGGKNDSRETNISKLYRSSISKKQTNAPIFTGDSLYQIIWAPLMPLLAQANTVSIAPDGVLHKIAFAALPMGKDLLLLDSFQLQQYSSVRQLAERSSSPMALKSVVLQGNANFDAGTTGNTGAWKSLPGTMAELTALNQQFTLKGLPVVIDSGNHATEENFKQLNGQAPTILHIATHGFFLPDPPTKNVTGIAAASNFSENSFARSEDPLMRSGIILAGANKYWSGENVATGKDYGILTAYEIAQTNLQGTALVVLSACETGLGDVQDGEGVFGLQRALKMAGVNNMVLSLWQVPDEETMELMQLFYSQLLQGQPTRKAFYQAQQSMRKKYPPYAWAAFVLME